MLCTGFFVLGWALHSCKSRCFLTRKRLPLEGKLSRQRRMRWHLAFAMGLWQRQDSKGVLPSYFAFTLRPSRRPQRYHIANAAPPRPRCSNNARPTSSASLAFGTFPSWGRLCVIASVGILSKGRLSLEELRPRANPRPLIPSAHRRPPRRCSPARSRCRIRAWSAPQSARRSSSRCPPRRPAGSRPSP